MTPARLDRCACALIAIGSLIAAVLLASSDRPERSAPLFVTAALSAFACAVPSPAIPRALFAGALALDASLTAGGVFESFNRGDHIGHLVLSALLVLLLAGTISWGETAGARLLTLTAVGVVAGLAWELLELISDAVAGTDMSLGLGDSLLDLTADVIGAALAAYWIVSSERRAGDPRRTHRR